MSESELPIERTLRHPVDSGGAFSYENWRAAVDGVRSHEALEYPLFSDAHIVGEAQFGPYLILNAIPDIEHTTSQVALVLRAEAHVTWSFADMATTDTSRYHGGTECDEIASLLSLALGCRLKAGDPSRWFKLGDDPRGRPWSFRSSGRADPAPPPIGRHGAVIAHARTQRDIGNVRPLVQTFVDIDPTASVALVRAARLYQDALWVSETDPALAWLLMVSAVEVAANHWRSAELSPREKLHRSKPTLEALLIANGGGELADAVASMIHESLGPTSKFIGFCLQYLPPPPEGRPELVDARLRWDSRREMKNALGQVYEYRSRALHDGTPFPAPMCAPPHSMGERDERPAFGAMGSHGGIWRKEDIPMFLHVFEHIVRGALSAWWTQLPRRAGLAK